MQPDKELQLTVPQRLPIVPCTIWHRTRALRASRPAGTAAERPDVGPKMGRLSLILPLFLTGCGMQNMLRTDTDDCRDYGVEEYVWSINEAIKDEVAHEPPNGYKTKPYEPAQWVEYWNARIFYMYDIGPDDCKGQYRGPTGPELIHYIIEQRRKQKLPEIPLEPRNVGRAS